MNIGQRMKKRRAALDMTLEDVAKMIGVSRQTMSRYETGAIGNIPADKIEAVAKALRTTPAFLMGWEDDGPAPAPVPTADDDGISAKYYRLNDQGQLMAMDYMDFLLTRHPVFPQLEEPEEDNVIRYPTVPWFLHPAAAGYSSPVLTEDYIDAALTPDLPQETDFFITVTGDSMEPYLHDRQRVCVQRCSSLEEGEVGVWSFEGETFVKQAVAGPFGEVYLLSANPAREDANKTIPADRADELKLLGRVILSRRLPLPHYN